MNASFPSTIAEKIRAFGNKFDGETLAATRALCTPLVKDQPSAGIRVGEDIPYGLDPRQKLDIYQPEGQHLPILVYVQGGGYRSGEKMDGVFYRNLGIYFARHGFITAIPNYRLAPQHKWPAGAEDVGATISHVRKEAERLGGDAERLFVFGQSAGATHVASYLFDSRFHPASGAGVTAAVLTSGGGYSVGPNPPPFRTAYFGEDLNEWEARSPITHVSSSKVPLFISVNEYDPGMLAAPSFDLARAVSLRDGKPPEFHFFRGHNHFSTVLSIGSQEDDVGGRIREFLANF